MRQRNPDQRPKACSGKRYCPNDEAGHRQPPEGGVAKDEDANLTPCNILLRLGGEFVGVDETVGIQIIPHDAFVEEGNAGVSDDKPQ